ncbi:MAG: 60 kDa inner rane insertion protein, preprotein translocase subunit YidC [Candidatus Magasanikbacteria bacterium]|nr:60 kDa inner rane insertion protein, preprotein translocase subunit YidC [Candidatus Magasanikbacteria bacterium]
MNFLAHLWTAYLYEPLLNFLIYLYNTYADHNLGKAVILLTISLRLILLPINIIAERNKVRYEMLKEKIRLIRSEFPKDPVATKLHVRDLVRKYRISPWAKTVMLGIQGLVLVLLYQVFISGIRGQRLQAVLYSFIDYPGKINTEFYGANIGEQNFYWALAVGVVLFAEIWIEFRMSKEKVVSKDMWYWILFPAVSVMILYYLPMVKSIFILTTLAFSYIMVFARRLFWSTAKSGHK